MAILGYARASIEGHPLEVQKAALIAAGASRVFHETASSAKRNRGVLANALNSLSSSDTLLVTRLDRLASSTRDLLTILNKIGKAKAAFRSLGDHWADTTGASGGSMQIVLAGLAEFELAQMGIRTAHGRARARARGEHLGRPHALSRHQRTEAVNELAQGSATQADLARRFDVSQSTISRLAGTIVPDFARSPLDAGTEHAARVFMQRILERYSVQEAILFGSRARGSHSAESDADIAVVLAGPHGKRSAAALDMAGIAFDVLLETGILVEALPLWEDEIKHPGLFSNPALIATIQREGVRL